MAPLFGPSVSDLEHLRSAVRALGTASVPGISAALSWRERKTEKLLAHELARPNSPLVYDPARRTVRWVASPPASAPAPVPVGAPSDAPPSPTPPTRLAPGPSFTAGGLKIRCPHCRVALLSTGSSGLLVCPQCGRLSSNRGPTDASPPPSVAPPPSVPADLGPARPRSAPTASPPPALPASLRIDPPTPRIAPPASPPATADRSLSPDRRSQEMFAAWVTNQPIPCPKCRTPLRHRGVRVYGCPACGQQVRFSDGGGPTTPGPGEFAPSAPPVPLLR